MAKSEKIKLAEVGMSSSGKNSAESNTPGVMKIAAALLIIVILVIILRQVESFIQPLFFAVFFFYISDPIAKSLLKHKVPSFIAHLVPMFLVIGILFLIGWIIGAHVDDLAARFPSYRDRLQNGLQSSLAWIYQHIPVLGARLKEFMSGQTIPLAPLEALVKAIVGNFFGFLSFSLMVVFYLIFLLQEAVSLPGRIESAYGKVKSDKILKIGQRINRGIILYVYVKGAASLLVGFLSTIAMLAFGLDLALLWGALVFFGNFIPYIGSAVAVLFPLMIGLLQFSSPITVLILAVVLIGCQVLVGNYLEPKFAGQQLNLSPIVVLVSLAFWGWLWGINGLILSIPIMVSLKFILENIDATHDIAIMMSHASSKKGS